MRPLASRAVLLAAGALLLALPATALAEPLVIGHRGASGYRPEHTLASYALAARMGADYVEPDLVPTKDGVLVARHEPNITDTTDVASHPEFADRRATKTIDGVEQTGWFTEDFTLAELRTLRAKERLPAVRQRNTLYDGRYKVPTFQEVIEPHAPALARARPDDRHLPGDEAPDVLPVARPRARAEARRDARAQQPQPPRRQGVRAVVRDREPQGARSAAARPARAAAGRADAQPADVVAAGGTTTYADLATPAGLAGIAEYADGVGPSKDYIVPRNPDQSLGDATSFVEDAHAAGLQVHPYTFRNENQFLPLEFRVGEDPNAYGNAFAEYELFFGLGVDGVFSDNPDTALAARDESDV